MGGERSGMYLEREKNRKYKGEEKVRVDRVGKERGRYGREMGLEG